MNVYRRWFYTIFAGIGIVLAILIWAVFAPVRLGGHSEYILISGNSMEPGIHTGDLIIVQPEKQYQSGDAVAYWNSQLNHYVFHRIIGLQLDHYLLQGDNNSWVDSYSPTVQELVGKQWIHIPQFGKWIVQFRQPFVIALTTGGIGGLIMVSFFTKSKKSKTKKQTSSVDWLTAVKEKFVRSGQKSSVKGLSVIRNRNTPQQGSDPSKQDWNARELNSSIEVSFFILGLVALASLVLGAFAFFNPVTRTDLQNLPYTQQAAYQYAAAAPAGVYDTRAVDTGDPVFTKLTCKVDLNYQYTLIGDGLTAINGTHQLTAVLTEPTSGWTRTLPLESKTKFTGSGFSSQAKVDFCELQTLAAKMEEQTGMAPYSYNLAIIPNVHVQGSLQNVALTDSFNAPLTFQMDKVHAFVTRDANKTDPFTVTQEGMIANPVIAPNTLSILGMKLPVRTARILSVIGLAVSLTGLLGLAELISRTSKRSKEMLVRMKYGSTMVDVSPRTRLTNRPAMDVNDIDDLARLAERSNSVILHQKEGGLHTYLVEGEKTTYRYILHENGGNPSADANLPHLPLDLRQAIEREELKVYYQPIVSLTDGKISAVEALLRWQHPQNGLISAKDFITAAESSGLIDSIGEWVLQTACMQIMQWRESGHNLRLAVNFSQRQIEHHPAQTIRQVLQRTGITADELQIEIPAGSLDINSSLVLSNIRELRQLGVKISLDGYSSQSTQMNLSELPVDSIKIDRKVIEKVNQPQEAEYVQGIISAALGCGLNVVAEGVETQDQMDFLRLQLCSQVQGFLIARPAPAEEISSLLLFS